MSGIRIHHPSHRNCIMLVSHPGETRSLFKVKNKGRKPKDYHIRLDSEGNAIVSETVWARLQEAGTSNFIVLNEVASPPTLFIGMQEGPVETPAMYKDMGDAIREIAPPGVRTYIRST